MCDSIQNRFSPRMKVLKSKDTHRRSQRSFSNKGASSTGMNQRLEMAQCLPYYQKFDGTEITMLNC